MDRKCLIFPILSTLEITGLLGSWFITNLNRIICHYICLLQFNKLSDSESHAITLTSIASQAFCDKLSLLHAIFGALFVSLFLMPAQLKHDHYTGVKYYNCFLLSGRRHLATRENYKNIHNNLMNFLSI